MAAMQSNQKIYTLPYLTRFGPKVTLLNLRYYTTPRHLASLVGVAWCCFVP